MLVIKQLMVPIDFHSISFPAVEVNGDQQLFASSKYFKISSFVFNIRKKLIQVWNDMRVRKWLHHFIFGWTIPLILNMVAPWVYQETQKC